MLYLKGLKITFVNIPKKYITIAQSHTQSDSSGGSRICTFSTFHNDHVHANIQEVKSANL